MTADAEEAQSLWNEWMDRVAPGEEVTITENGLPVARLVPVSREETVGAVIEQIKQLSKGLSLGGMTIREAINEGRKY